MSFILVPIIFIIVRVSGYFEIMRKLCWEQPPEMEWVCQVIHEIKSALEEQVSDLKS